jgi:type VI secretion system protein ImpJ
MLVAELHEDFLMAGGNGAGRGALRGVFGLQALLADMRGGMQVHPYHLFTTVRGAYIDLCVLRDVFPSAIEKAYDHDDLVGAFAVLIERLEEQSHINRKTIPYREFQRKDGLLSCELSAETKKAKNVFLLIQKGQVTGKLDLKRTKVASESRIRLVYERSLQGIPFQHIENPPFQHNLSSTVEFYAITPGQEWDFAVREGKIVLYDGPELQGSRFYLYWRGE